MRRWSENIEMAALVWYIMSRWASFQTVRVSRSLRWGLSREASAGSQIAPHQSGR